MTSLSRSLVAAVVLAGVAPAACQMPNYEFDNEPLAAGAPAAGLGASAGMAAEAGGRGGSAVASTASGGAGAGGTAGIASTAGAGSPGRVTASGGESGGESGSGGENATGGSGEDGEAPTHTCAMLPAVPDACTCEDADGHAYLYCSDSRTWPIAAARCAQLGLRLATIDSQLEQNLVGRAGKARGFWLYWVGGQRPAGYAPVLRWAWVDGSEFWQGEAAGQPLGSYFNWLPGEPNSSSDGACVLMEEKGWNDAPCSEQWPYVCEWE